MRISEGKVDETKFNDDTSMTEVAIHRRKSMAVAQGVQVEMLSNTGQAKQPERKLEHPTTNLDTLMHILKANVGTGILAMPEAFKNSGLATGTVGLVIISLFSVHCMHLLVRTARILYKRQGVTELSYPDVAEIALKTGPHAVRRYAMIFRGLTNVFICITSLGFCCVYILFAADNFHMAFNWITGSNMSLKQYMWIVLPFIIVVNFVRNLKYLAFSSTLANVLEIFSLGVIFYYTCQDLPDASSRPQFNTIGTLPLWFGTAIFAFEGINLVLPLENNMKTPQDFGGWTGVLNTAMVVVTCCYTGVGFFGYLKFGNDIESSITLNLPDLVISQIVKIAYGIAIYFSYPVQFYVPLNIIWEPIKKKIPVHPRFHLVLELAFRVILIMLTFVLAYTIPQLGLFISLVGSLSGSFVSLILPPILHSITRWNEDKFSRWTVAKDAVICLVGIIGFITGTYASLRAIVDAFRDGDI